MIMLLDGDLNSGRTTALYYYAVKELSEGKILVAPEGSLIGMEHEVISIHNMFEYLEDRCDLAFFFDHSYIFYDSRSNMSRKNRDFVYFCMQSERMKFNIYLSAMSFMHVDKRIRTYNELIYGHCSFSRRKRKLYIDFSNTKTEYEEDVKEISAPIAWISAIGEWYEQENSLINAALAESVIDRVERFVGEHGKCD